MICDNLCHLRSTLFLDRPVKTSATVFYPDFLSWLPFAAANSTIGVIGLIRRGGSVPIAIGREEVEPQHYSHLNIFR